MKRSSLLLLGVLTAGCVVLAQNAQSPVGTIIKGFTLPQRNAKGEP
jgi:hypothetical protein